jgi:hypothetical protein
LVDRRVDRLEMAQVCAEGRIAMLRIGLC